METITIKRQISDEVKKVVWGPVKVAEVHVRDVWDSHGDIITSDNHVFKNKEVSIIKREWTEFNRRWKITEAVIDGKTYDGEIIQAHGDTDKLELTACIGAG